MSWYKLFINHLCSSSSSWTPDPKRTVRILNLSSLDDNPSNGVWTPRILVERTYFLFSPVIGTLLFNILSCWPLGLAKSFMYKSEISLTFGEAASAGPKQWSRLYGSLGLILLGVFDFGVHDWEPMLKLCEDFVGLANCIRLEMEV